MISDLVVVSDGIVGVTDVHVLDSIVQQLRASTVACSFLHVGSTYHPHCSNALVPYQDLLHFLASTTLGNYMTFVPQIVSIHLPRYRYTLQSGRESESM